MLIDTHCHLTNRFFGNPKPIVDAAIKNGVEKMICIGTNLEDSAEAIEIANKFEGLYASVGIHPEENCDNWNKFEKLISQPKVVAIGECGIDNKVGLPGQKEVFIKQIEIAQKYNLPLVIHSRDSKDETVQILEKYKGLKGVFHFYSFGKKFIPKVLEMGFYFGVDGNLTYEQGFSEVIKAIPLEYILLETDTPFLTPIPYRGLLNEPKNVRITAQYLADIKDLTIEDVAEITTANAQKLFGIN